MAKATGYPRFEQDDHGHYDSNVDPGKVVFDESSGRVVCLLHGDVCATDGTLLREATSAPQIGINEEGIALFDADNPVSIGQARLYRCMVCGQGTWTHLA